MKNKKSNRSITGYKICLNEKLIFLSLFMISFFYQNSWGQDCFNKEIEFYTYEKAINKIRKLSFSIHDKMDTNKSSWIKNVEYFSCDKKRGYLILTTRKNKEYLHKNIPVNLWYRFKKASSYGSFYNKEIKNKYQY